MFDMCMKRHVVIKDNTKTARSHQRHIRIDRMEKDNTLLDEHGLRLVMVELQFVQIHPTAHGKIQFSTLTLVASTSADLNAKYN